MCFFVLYYFNYYYYATILVLQGHQQEKTLFLQWTFIQVLCIQRLITKICDKLKCLNRHRSKSIGVTKLSFCQNDSPLSKSFWQKDSLVTLILFDLCIFKHSIEKRWTENLCIKLKFLFSRKATKIDEIFNVNLTLTYYIMSNRR